MSFCFTALLQGMITVKEQSKRIAACGLTTALGIALMFLGTFLGLGMYLIPMLVGMCLTPIGTIWGRKYQILLWFAIGLLSILLISAPEQNLMFFGLFGWYPILRPILQKLPKLPRVIMKLLVFNIVTVALESLLMFVLFPEALSMALTIFLLVLGNITFLVYDMAIPRFEHIALKHLKQLFK